jgi:chitin disaccharide deacetylase
MNHEIDRLSMPSGSLSLPPEEEYLPGPALASEPARVCGEAPHAGLVVTADDWGSEPRTTKMILDCALRGAVSSVSAMVFMEDSERAAATARERGIEAGLHLNLTTAFSAPECPGRLREHQQLLARCLLKSRLAQVMFYPGLTRSFAYVVAAQLEEFRRLYGTDPEFLDGHRHMHLCTNVLLQGLLPPGTLVRRSFSFRRGEKGLANRLYRRLVDGMLHRRHRLVDFFFSLVPFESPGRLHRVFALAREFAVEVMAHPANLGEYRFLEGGEMLRQAQGVRIMPRSAVLRREQ